MIQPVFAPDDRVRTRFAATNRYMRKWTMLEHVERTAIGISWPAFRHRDRYSVKESEPKMSPFLRRKKSGFFSDAQKRWSKEPKNLLCSFAQLRCSDTYSSDTIGTWKFERITKNRYKHKKFKKCICKISNLNWNIIRTGKNGFIDHFW